MRRNLRALRRGNHAFTRPSTPATSSCCIFIASSTASRSPRSYPRPLPPHRHPPTCHASAQATRPAPPHRALLSRKRSKVHQFDGPLPRRQPHRAAIVMLGTDPASGPSITQPRRIVIHMQRMPNASASARQCQPHTSGHASAAPKLSATPPDFILDDRLQALPVLDQSRSSGAHIQRSARSRDAKRWHAG